MQKGEFLVPVDRKPGFMKRQKEASKMQTPANEEYPYVLIVGPKKGQRCRIVDLGWRSRLGYGSRHIETEDGSHITINRLFLRRKDHGNLSTNTAAGDHPQT